MRQHECEALQPFVTGRLEGSSKPACCHARASHRSRCRAGPSKLAAGVQGFLPVRRRCLALGCELVQPKHVAISVEQRSIDMLKQHLAKHHAFAPQGAWPLAVKLPTYQLPLFLQAQVEKAAVIKPGQAERLYGITLTDIAKVPTASYSQSRKKKYFTQVHILHGLKCNTVLMIHLHQNWPLQVVELSVPANWLMVHCSQWRIML